MNFINYEFKNSNRKCDWCLQKGNTYKVVNNCKYTNRIICSNCLYDKKRRKFFLGYINKL
jgi:superfamily II helicase